MEENLQLTHTHTHFGREAMSTFCKASCWLTASISSNGVSFSCADCIVNDSAQSWHTENTQLSILLSVRSRQLFKSTLTSHGVKTFANTWAQPRTELWGARSVTFHLKKMWGHSFLSGLDLSMLTYMCARQEPGHWEESENYSTMFCFSDDQMQLAADAIGFLTVLEMCWPTLRWPVNTAGPRAESSCLFAIVSQQDQVLMVLFCFLSLAHLQALEFLCYYARLFLGFWKKLGGRT